MMIGVVIVSYNTRELLRGCLNSLRGCALPLRIVVVDNGSADGSAALVAQEFPEAELLALTENLGFAAGTNVGLRQLGALAASGSGALAASGSGALAASGSGAGERGSNQTQSPLAPERAAASAAPLLLSGGAAHAPERAATSAAPTHFLLLNPDTIVHPGAIETLAAFLTAHPRVGLVGPRLLNLDGSYQPAAFRFPTLSMTALDLFPPGEVLPGRLYNSWWHGRYPQERQANAPFAIDHPLGACMLVRPEVLAQVGLLDETYFMYAEEVEWCRRIRAAGWAIFQEPRASVTHVGGASTSQFRGKMQIALYQSRLRYFATHERPLTVWLHRRLIRAGLRRWTLLAWAEFARGRLNAEQLRERLAVYGQIARL